MPYLKVTYGSSHNVTVQGTEYIEVSEEDLPQEPAALSEYLTEQWQYFVNEYMADTDVMIVESEGD
jgi:hypothetical protein